MTRKKLNDIIIAVVTFYLMSIAAAVLLRIYDSSCHQVIYETFIDLVPLFFAIPLGYLGYCFNKRKASEDSKRKLWDLLVDVVNDATHATYKTEVQEIEYRENLKNIGKAIDKIRCEYKNIKTSNGATGFYPYEPIKEIYRIYENMEFGKNISIEEKTKTRDDILVHWKSIRDDFLYEIDRYEPEKPVSPHHSKK